MNFLSHFYFEQKSFNAYQACGMILPDLVKNANKSWNLYPQKKPDLFQDNVLLRDLLIGWERHLQVDLIFHDSVFFKEHTASLKQALIPLLSDSPIRPSFLAHIALELLLDHLLWLQNLVNITKFYEALEEINQEILAHFLHLCGVTNTHSFFSFYEQFKSSRYLFSYQKLENLSYALRRICMRIWPEDFPESRLNLLTECLEKYAVVLESNYLSIFHEIDAKLLQNSY